MSVPSRRRTLADLLLPQDNWTLYVAVGQAGLEGRAEFAIFSPAIISPTACLSALGGTYGKMRIAGRLGRSNFKTDMFKDPFVIVHR